MLVFVVLLGNVVVILFSGVFKWLGEKWLGLSGNGEFVKLGVDVDLLKIDCVDEFVSLSFMGVGLLISCVFFIFGVLFLKFMGILGLILMIVSVVVLKVLKVLLEKMELGVY